MSEKQPWGQGPHRIHENFIDTVLARNDALASALEEAQKECDAANTKIKKLETATQAFLDGWEQFCSKINFGASPLNGEAIRFMNEVPGKLRAALK